LEEGYTTTVNRLVGQTDAINRLQRFLSTVLRHLGGPSERERFYLFPELIPLPQHTTEPFAGGVTFELQAYLDYLDQQSDQAVDIAPCLERADQMQCWQTNTQVLMTEMVAFLHWICTRLAQPVPVVPVPLLRDTLGTSMSTAWAGSRPVPATHRWHSFRLVARCSPSMGKRRSHRMRISLMRDRRPVQSPPAPGTGGHRYAGACVTSCPERRERQGGKRSVSRRRAPSSQQYGTTAWVTSGPL
jgi:hypothetical protein